MRLEAAKIQSSLSVIQRLDSAQLCSFKLGTLKLIALIPRPNRPHSISLVGVS